ncbi:hypothetical protein PTKIN_Ptkin02bG0053600 [Pterospermum kingtungense]
MAQIRKMDCQVEIKSQADKFYHGFKKFQQLPKICSQLFKDVKLVQGDWDSVGSVRHWSYAADGKSDIFNETLMDVNDKNKTVVFKMLEGSGLGNSYKSWKTIVNVTPKGEGSLVKWTVEYEKQNESVPEPLIFIDFFTIWTNSVDAACPL